MSLFDWNIRERNLQLNAEDQKLKLYFAIKNWKEKKLHLRKQLKNAHAMRFSGDARTANATDLFCIGDFKLVLII